LSIDTLQQQQQSESNFAVHDHAAMVDKLDHQQQATILNPNHLHHPQSHIHQTMPGKKKEKKRRSDAILTKEAIDHRSSYILRRVYAISLSACSSSLSL
jgi:hypothetical protein